MNVAIVNLTSGGLSGGYAKYLRRLIPLLRQDARISRLTVFLPETASVPTIGPARTWPARDGVRGFASLQREIESVSPDVVFFPTARRIECGTATVVMVRNMEPLTVPFGGNTLRESLRNLARARAAKAACRDASRVIAVSQHVRTFVTGRWRIAADRVGLVYHGTDTPEAIGAVPAAGPWPARFLFTAGSIRPARGLEDLIRALALLHARGVPITLVIAGRADRSAVAYERRMHRLAQQLGVQDAVVWTGQLDEAQMSAAYARCVAFVVTSRAEACPNVALEAMSHGAAIVSTTQPPMPEFFADAADYYAPRSAGELAARLGEVIAQPVDSERRARVLARAATFSWQRTADQTIEQLQLAAGRAS